MVLRLPTAAGALEDVLVEQDGKTPVPNVWSGHLSDDKFSAVTFARSGGAIAGLVTATTGPAYRLRRDGHRVIVERISYIGASSLDAAIRDDACTSTMKTILPVSCPGTETTPIVDVTVAYTDAARYWAGGNDSDVLAWIELAVGRTNESFQQSKANVVIRLAGTPVGVGWKESGHVEPDYLALRNGKDKELERVHRQREQDSGDLVVLVVGPPDASGYACTFKKADLRTNAFADRGYAIVPIDGLASKETFTHEIGHLLGAWHGLHEKACRQGAPCDCPGAFSDSCGYQVETPSKAECAPWNTVMVDTRCGKCTTILRWSKPDLLRCHDLMGVPDKANNVATLNRTACTVSKLLPTPQ